MAKEVRMFDGRSGRIRDRHASARERFERFIMPEPNSGCWLWIGATQRGYGTLMNDDHRLRPAHRLSYEWFIGPIPYGLELDHKCRVKCCVNPAHLEPVTRRENMIRAQPYRKDRQKSHCKRGHKYEAGSYFGPADGTKICRLCMNERRRKKRTA